jgi:hypothetical protein
MVLFIILQYLQYPYVGFYSQILPALSLRENRLLTAPELLHLDVQWQIDEKIQDGFIVPTLLVLWLYPGLKMRGLGRLSPTLPLLMLVPPLLKIAPLPSIIFHHSLGLQPYHYLDRIDTCKLLSSAKLMTQCFQFQLM